MAIIVAGASCGTADAQSSWATDSIYSNVLGETRYFRVTLPVGYEVPRNSIESYPVLILLDGGGQLIADIAKTLTGGRSPTIPPLIVVSVENIDDSTRFRDMTLPAAAGKPDRVDGGGGAFAFLGFLQNELRPYLDSRYRTYPFTVIRGHSLAGFFARWAFGEAPDFLDAAIASSPTPLETERVLDAIATRGRPGRLIMLSGAGEVGLSREAASFAAALHARNVAGLQFEYERIQDASHYAAHPLGITPSLRFIFRPVSLSGYQVEFDDESDTPAMLAKFTATFDSTRAAYQRGARELGLPERLPFGFLNDNRAMYQATATAPLLSRLCEEMIASYPLYWQSYECSGDVLTRLGQRAEGTAEYQRAVEAALNLGEPIHERLAGKLSSP